MDQILPVPDILLQFVFYALIIGRRWPKIISPGPGLAKKESGKVESLEIRVTDSIIKLLPVRFNIFIIKSREITRVHLVKERFKNTHGFKNE